LGALDGPGELGLVPAVVSTLLIGVASTIAEIVLLAALLVAILVVMLLPSSVTA
jgi:hypothetical protein